MKDITSPPRPTRRTRHRTPRTYHLVQLYHPEYWNPHSPASHIAVGAGDGMGDGRGDGGGDGSDVGAGLGSGVGRAVEGKGVGNGVGSVEGCGVTDGAGVGGGTGSDDGTAVVGRGDGSAVGGCGPSVVGCGDEGRLVGETVGPSIS